MIAKAPSCVVCDLSDARALTHVRLASGERATVCGTHALMQRRDGRPARTVAELRAKLGDRRERTRRAEEHDELACELTAAFSGDCRAVDRRLS